MRSPLRYAVPFPFITSRFYSFGKMHHLDVYGIIRSPSARRIYLSAREIHILTHLSHARSSAQGLSKRARIILFAWHQKTNTRIHEILKVSKTTVIKWRDRYAQALEAIRALLDTNCKDAVLRAKIKDVLTDAPRKGTTPRITGEEKIALVGLACEPLPQPGLPFLALG